MRLEHVAVPCLHQSCVAGAIHSEKSANGLYVEIAGGNILAELLRLKLSGRWPRENLAFIAHDLMARAVALACRRLAVASVVGAGGVFQNLLFASLLETHLAEFGISFELPKKIPINDQSIAIGQLLYTGGNHA
jgi:hydrogenase maturation factor HypF (carbamoyltransferase family)